MPRRKKLTVVNKTKELKEQIVTAKGKYKAKQYILPLTEQLYITQDKHCWIICLNDKPILFGATLQDILKTAVDYNITIGKDYKTLAAKINNIYSLIESRIPTNFKPNDLFKEMVK